MSEANTEELARPAEPGGVGEPVAAPPGAAGQTPTAETPTAKVPREQPQNLDDVPEFRAYKASRDRQYSEQLQRSTAAERRLEDMQAQLAQAQLRDARPEEIATYYQGELSRVKQQHAQEQAQALEQGRIYEAAQGMLRELGIPLDTPGLEWGETPSWEGLTRLQQSALRIFRNKSGAQAAQQTVKSEEVARAARQKAIKESGVAQVSSAPGSARTNLQTEYQERLKRIQHKPGFAMNYTMLKKEFRERGFEP